MSYPNDLKEEEWEIVKEYFGSKKKGRRIKVDRRAIVNAIFYQRIPFKTRREFDRLLIIL